MKKKIKIDFVDFWPGFKKDDNFFYNILIKYFDVEITSKPDYLFSSCFGHKHFDYQNCVKIYYTGENIIPDFNLFDFAMGFHYIDFEDRYLRLPHYVLYKERIDGALHKHEHPDEYYLEKKKFCNYVVSNPYAASEREQMMNLLEAYGQVDSGGRFRNNVGGPVEDKIAFSSQYKFTLAFENSAMSGYTTEKIFDAFSACTIPIYWGSDRVNEEFNPESFINAKDFPDLESVIAEVKRINEDDEAFLKMMKAPIAPEGFQAHECLQPDYADEFLKHIFDIDIATAKRRNMVYIGRDYQKRLRDANQIQSILAVVKRPIYFVNRKRAQFKSRRSANK